jgi:hypothetical protein
MELQTLLRFTVLSASVATLVACSSADTATPANTPTAVTISGSIFAAPVSQATLTVKNGNGDTVVEPMTTNADSTYTIDMLDTDLASDLVFESTGGEFTDETTGNPNVTAGAMSAYVAGATLSSGDSVHVTPGTTITADMVTKHNSTLTTAKTYFSRTFGYNPDILVKPVDITTDAALTASDESRFAGFYAAAFSKLANDIGLGDDKQFGMFSDMAKDLSDGELDGLDSAGDPVTIGTSTNILKDFIDTVGSYKTAETQTYKITYDPLSMMTSHGKAHFQISVTDKSDAPQPGLVTSGELKVMPMMYMNAGHKHTTPMGEITESGTAGTYDVTLYYVMASRMGEMAEISFSAMGTWDLKVSIGSESVHFYPNVMMAMGDTVVAQLKAQNSGTDTVMNMDGLEESRTYFIFRENLDESGNGPNYTFEMFLATRDTMMDFPVVDKGETLDSAAGPITLTSVDVQVSTDGTNFTSADNPDDSTGYFSLSGLDISGGKLYVKLTVDDELKTTDGLPADNSTDPDDTNMHAVFTVTAP